jgi:hypothetical protein
MKVFELKRVEAKGKCRRFRDKEFHNICCRPYFSWSMGQEVCLPALGGCGDFTCLFNPKFWSGLMRTITQSYILLLWVVYMITHVVVWELSLLLFYLCLWGGVGWGCKWWGSVLKYKIGLKNKMEWCELNSSDSS